MRKKRKSDGVISRKSVQEKQASNPEKRRWLSMVQEKACLPAIRGRRRSVTDELAERTGE